MSNISLNKLVKKRVILSLSIILFLGIVLEIWLVNSLSTYGEQISKLEKTSLDLALENRILKNQLDQKKSMAFIEEQAKKLDMDKSYQVEYLKPIVLSLNSN